MNDDVGRMLDRSTQALAVEASSFAIEGARRVMHHSFIEAAVAEQDVLLSPNERMVTLRGPIRTIYGQFRDVAGRREQETRAIQ